MDKINVWAVIAAAASAFLLGGFWHSPALFGTAWNQASGQTPQSGHPPRVFALSFLFSLISAGAFAFYLGPRPELSSALIGGLVVGIGFVAASFGINYQFANRPTGGSGERTKVFFPNP
jgi:hypothetical protein